MTRVVWGKTGERFYETGVDRGVLYVDTLGVPWNGLTAVKEAPVGGDPQPYYLDGVKFANISAAEEYEASIEAFSSPPEFGKCDGTVSIQNGLFITQQRRSKFSFCYRTRQGNDVRGLDYGYKLHLVYNALAAPSSREHGSISDSIAPATLSWNISTTPPRATGYRPTAHMIVDSTKTDATVLAQLEDLLYGTDAAAPRMPTQSELIALFA